MSSHPGVMSRPPTPGRSGRKYSRPLEIPAGKPAAEVCANAELVTLTNLQKVFWPEGPITKRDLLQYYADISSFLLPHLLNRAMVMKRYPDGAYGKFFFQD